MRTVGDMSNYLAPYNINKSFFTIVQNLKIITTKVSKEDFYLVYVG
jgi:hypothetical protein